MKSRLLIVIGILFIVTIIFTIDNYLVQIHNEDIFKQIMIDCSRGGVNPTVNSSDNLNELRFRNSTHFIDNLDCMWIPNDTFANTALETGKTHSDKIEILQISKNEILSKGTGFDLPEDTFTQEDLRKLEQSEKELNQITDDPDTLEEKRRQIHLEIQEMQDRLQYPFQTGVSYSLVQILREKYDVFKEHRSDLKEVWVTYSSSNDISHVHHALRLGIHPDHFTLSELEYQDKKIREYLGNKVNILYEPALIIPNGK